MKLVSVIIPVYNIEKYIEKCLLSVQKQTYKNLQIIIVDDGSSDKSGKICDKFAKGDTRFEVIHKKNEGAACAKNNALDRIKGEYFIFVDGDDYLDESMIEYMLCILQKEDADIVEVGFYEEYTTRSKQYRITEYKTEICSIDYTKNYINTWTNSLLWNKLYKTSLTKNVRFHREKRCIDDEFYTYKIILNANKIIQIPESFYHYRKRKGSAMNDVNHERQKTNDFITLLPERYENVIKKYPELDLCFLTHMADSFLVIRNEYYLDNELKKYLRKYLKKYFLKFMLNRIGIGIKIELFKTMLKINGTTDVKKQKLTDDMFD